jgi:hypothetical protein
VSLFGREGTTAAQWGSAPDAGTVAGLIGFLLTRVLLRRLIKVAMVAN